MRGPFFYMFIARFKINRLEYNLNRGIWLVHRSTTVVSTVLRHCISTVLGHTVGF